jgi:hypothetical protein
MSDGVLLSGNLSEIRLPTLLMSLYRDRETGVLTLKDERFTKGLYIKEGKVVYATTSDPDQRLGECLLRRGIITLKQYDLSENEVLLGRQQGRALVDMGALTSSELLEGVTQQLYEVIISLFHYRTGTYALELAPFSTLEMVTLAIEIPAAIFMGMCRETAWSQMRAMVGVPGLRFRTSLLQPAFVADLELTEDQEHILRICRDGLPVESILEASYMPQFETLRLLWVFLTLGLMEREDPRRRPQVDAGLQPEALVDQYNDVYAFIHHHLMAAGVREQELAPLGDGIASAHPALGSNQSDLVHFGRLDVDALLFALRAIPEPDRPQALQAFLEEALYALVLEADRRLPQDQRDAVKAYIRRKADSSQEG